jgi:membrane-associated phospholipid phosphatase
LVIRKHQLPKWLLSAQALLALGIVFAVVYTGEHYLVDGVVGIVYALAAWWLVQWILARRQAAQKVHPHPAPAPASN